MTVYATTGTTSTLPEQMVARELDRLGVDYQTQNPMFGGRDQPGGLVADFYIPYYGLIISVIGTYWHQTPGRRAQDSLQRTVLAGQGITTIYITDEMILRNARYYVEAALRLEDYSGWGKLL